MVKLLFDRDTLVNALELVSLSVSKKDLNSIISCAVFDVTADQKVFVKASNQRVMSISPVEALEVSETAAGSEVSFACDAAGLLQFAKNGFVDRVYLTYDPVSQDVCVTCGSSEVHFRTLNTDLFPTFKRDLEESQAQFRIGAPEFHDALNYTKSFVYMEKGEAINDHQRSFQILQVKNALVAATNGMMAGFYQYHKTIASDFRVHREELKPLLSFLKAVGDQQIEVLAMPKLYFVRSESGDVFGFSAPNLALDPRVFDMDLTMHTADDGDNSQHFYVNPQDILQAMKQLQASAAPNDTNVTLTLKGGGASGSLDLAMLSAGGRTQSRVVISCVRAEGQASEVEVALNVEMWLSALQNFKSASVGHVLKYKVDRFAYLRLVDTQGFDFASDEDDEVSLEQDDFHHRKVAVINLRYSG